MASKIARPRKTVRDIRDAKGREPLVALTAYTAPMAEIIDPHADMILIGDSVGQVVHGLPDTMSVTMEMMLLHSQAVMRGSRRALVVTDMPFASYHGGWQSAFDNAARLVKDSGCQAVKIECGGDYTIDIVAALTERGIAVIAHLGLLPQEVHVRGGHVVRGRGDGEREALVSRAAAAERAGAFALIVEGVYEDIAAEMTANARCPVIGIGASARCDGQILVTEDLIGMSGQTPRFVRRYAEVGKTVAQAVAEFAGDVRARDFPQARETYGHAAHLRARSAAC